MPKPTIKQLKQVAELYFDDDCPPIRYKKMDSMGCTNLKTRAIDINAVIDKDDVWSCCVGHGSYTTIKPFRLNDSEQYFMVLLHEIGHLLMPAKIPKHYTETYERMKKAYPDEIPLRHLSVRDFFRRRTGETDERYFVRLDLFENWIWSGDMMINHYKVEQFSVKEFKRRRKLIQKILSE